MTNIFKKSIYISILFHFIVLLILIFSVQKENFVILKTSEISFTKFDKIPEYNTIKKNISKSGKNINKKNNKNKKIKVSEKKMLGLDEKIYDDGSYNLNNKKNIDSIDKRFNKNLNNNKINIKEKNIENDIIKGNENFSKLSGKKNKKSKNRLNFKWSNNSEVRRLINSPAYPKYFKTKGLNYEVIVRFKVKSTGRVENVTIILSSGNTKLDIAVKSYVREFVFNKINKNIDIYGTTKIIFKN